MNQRTQAELIESVHNREPVAGLTHQFYRYPARFSPLFARAAIKAFTKPGDTVLDPFMGGGTTLVEARALGRRSIGIDINELAVFVARTKTTLFSESDLARVLSWAEDVIDNLSLRSPSTIEDRWAKLSYQRNISDSSTWPIRKTLELALARVGELSALKQQRLARCALLRTAQWALDCRTHTPSTKQFRQRLILYLNEMIEDAREYVKSVRKADRLYDASGSFRSLCLHRSAIGLEDEKALRNGPAPALILTSPPYPGVHVLYHRWQIQGRRETSAPFWITNSVDGNGASFYTFGDRKQLDLTYYFRQVYAAFSSLAHVSDRKTWLVQMIAFSDPSWQLPEYLSVMERAGFGETRVPALSNSSDGRVWRFVPHRKWYANQQGQIPTSKEVVLFHRLA